VPCVASFSVFSNVYESLAGYLPKLEFKYFDPSCPEAPLKQNEASTKKNKKRVTAQYTRYKIYTI